MRLRPFYTSVLAVLTAFVSFGSPIDAQLDLPSGGVRRPPPARGSSSSRRGALELPRRARGELAPRPNGASETGEGGLSLPNNLVAPVPVVTPLAVEPTAEPDAAAQLFEELHTLRDPDDPRALAALQQLTQLGEPGRVAARDALPTRRAASIVIASRLLLDGEVPEDRQLVVDRLRQPLPTGAATPLLRELFRRDPMLGSPEFLADLLEHPSGGMRAAAQRELEDRVDSATLPFLAAKLQSSRDDTRWRALQLIGLVDDPSVLHLLINQLGDSKSKVAGEAVRILAGSNDERVEGELLQLAFQNAVDGQPMERADAFALLALVEREDRRNVQLLGDEHIPPLVDQLDSPLEIAAGASASALAGIGFRGAAAGDTRWLDLMVPHQLVRLSSGAVFHRDFAVLQPIALRRLATISGLSYGGNGPAWQQWWTDAAQTFRARRAVIVLEPGDEDRLVVSRRDPARGQLDLVGPQATEASSTALFLSSEESHALTEVLRREGAFDVERLPASASDDDHRVLAVRIGEQSKRFAFRGPAPAWFERLNGAVTAVARRNVWQRYLERDARSTARELWERERAFWDAEQDELARATRLKALILRHLDSVSEEARDAGLEDLTALYLKEGVASAEDAPALLALLRDELFYGPRVHALFELILASTDAAPEGEAPDDALTALTDALVAGFGDEALPELVRLLSHGAGGGLSPRAEAAATDERPLLRRAAAMALGHADDPDATAICLRLLNDPDLDVERAAVVALGEGECEEALTELMVRARLAPSELRAEALLAIGRIGGDGVRDALLLGLAEEDLRIQLGAVQGLAELADPSSAALLASVFARGTASPLFEPAQAGLRSLGEDAHSELLRIAYAPNARSRREAALLLAESGAPEVATTLVSILMDRPGDVRVAEELAVLTGMDFRGEPDPAQSYWDWWDLVVHDDSLSWVRGAAERAGIPAPGPEAFDPEVRLEGVLFFLALARAPLPHLAERGRRELSHLLDRDVPSMHAGSIGKGDAATDARAADLEREIRLLWDGTSERAEDAEAR